MTFSLGSISERGGRPARMEICVSKVSFSVASFCRLAARDRVGESAYWRIGVWRRKTAFRHANTPTRRHVPLAAAHFDRNKNTCYFEDRTLNALNLKNGYY